jgi:predicted nucleic acid-binding protein
MSAVFVDTNVLVYAQDRADAAKNAVAVDLLQALGRRRAFVSTQVLSEFASVLTHGRKLARSAALAAADVLDASRAFAVLQVEAETILSALEAQERWGLSYWDAQIWAAAALADVPVVVSEDFADGLELGGVRFADPFAEGFDLDAL